jgi:hypothetical protein
VDTWINNHILLDLGECEFRWKWTVGLGYDAPNGFHVDNRAIGVPGAKYHPGIGKREKKYRERRDNGSFEHPPRLQHWVTVLGFLSCRGALPGGVHCGIRPGGEDQENRAGRDRFNLSLNFPFLLFLYSAVLSFLIRAIHVFFSFLPRRPSARSAVPSLLIHVIQLFFFLPHQRYQRMRAWSFVRA